MKSKLLNELDTIDPIYINEHLEWGKISKNKRTILYRSVSVAACLVLMVTSMYLLIPGGIYNTVDPIDTLLNETQNGDYNDPHSMPTKKVYSENYEIGNSCIDPEYVRAPVPPGCVMFTGSLYDIMYDDEPYADSSFAVSLSFTRKVEESEEYLSLVAEANELFDSMHDRYMNDFASHALKVHKSDVWNLDCEVCLQYHDLHVQDQQKIEELERQASKVRKQNRDERNKEFREYQNSLLESMGLNYRFVTINWINVEPIITQELRILYLTKEQLLNFKVPDEIGAEFILLPEWVDCGEDMINRDYNLYPLQSE